MDRFKFLFTGDSAMQQDAIEEAFEPRRIAVVRGRSSPGTALRCPA